jgi:hypothetical protein
VSAPSTPFPPRFKWLKRLTIVFILYLLTVLGVNLVVRHRLRAAFQARIAASHARGDQVLFADFERQSTPRDLNAADDLLDAAGALRSSKEYQLLPSDFSHVKMNYPLDAATLANARLFIHNNGGALALVRGSRKKAVCDWRLGSGPGSMIDAMGDRLVRMQELAGALNLAIVVAHHDGRDADAIHYYCDSVYVARLMTADDILLPLLMCEGERTAASVAFGSIVPTLHVVRRRHPGSEDLNSVTIDELRSLLRDARDERWFRDAYARALRQDAMFMFDYLDAFERNRPPVIMTFWGDPCELNPRLRGLYLNAMLPILHRNAVELYDEGVADAGRVQSGRAIPSAPPATSPWRSQPPLGPNFHTKYAHVDRNMRQGERQCRLLILALAIRLYKIDHGAQPRSLQALVGTELDQLPLDPITNAPLAYPLPGAARSAVPSTARSAGHP